MAFTFYITHLVFLLAVCYHLFVANNKISFIIIIEHFSVRDRNISIIATMINVIIHTMGGVMIVAILIFHNSATTF